MQRITLVSLAAVLFAASCSGGGADTTTTVTTVPPAASSAPATLPPATSSSTTTTTSSTTTTVPPQPSSPLNGIPVDDASMLERRVMAVKIDNHANARPQAGIQLADAMVEIRVEAGLTRFIALFHQSDATYLGPVRSGRPTDGNFLAHLGAPFAISGAQSWVQRYIRNRNVELIGDSRPEMFRVGGGRFAPHNLFTNTELLRELADARGYPDEPPEIMFPIGEFRPDEQDAGEVVLDFSDETTITWRWDGDEYLRFHNGREHEWVDQEGEGGQITADLLVVIVGSFYTAYDPGGQGSAVPATETIGVGPAFVFSEGAVAKGVWFREDASQPFGLVTEDESEVLHVPPGIPWVSIFPAQRELTWGPYEPPPQEDDAGASGDDDD